MSLVIPDVSAWMRAGEWAANTVPNGEPPYWVQIWPASVAMARLLWRRGNLAGKAALDLGCGLGVPGIAAARAGAAVTFADVKPDALAFASWNAARQGNATVPAVVELDWSRSVVPGTFDLLLLADVSYRPVHHSALQRHCLQALRPDGVVLHADPLRRESTPFCQWLRQNMATADCVRRTSFLDRSLDVRLIAASPSAESLAPWRRLLDASPVDTSPGDPNPVSPSPSMRPE